MTTMRPAEPWQQRQSQPLGPDETLNMRLLARENESPGGAIGTDSADGGPSKKKSPSKHARLASLDIVRGFTMCTMILVDELGEAYPSINHSPWNNVTLADIVMPWFLFMVGTSMAFSFRKYKGTHADRIKGTKAALTRAFKLYLLGLLMQGGGWPGGYSYGYNIQTIRWCGILNRIGYAYFVAAMFELWLPEIKTSVSTGSEQRSGPCRLHLDVFLVHGWKWLAASLVVVFYLILTFATYVPTWTSKWGRLSPNDDVVLLEQPFEVKCGVRGWTKTPECSAAGFYDRLLFGQNHLGNWMSERLPECNTCSPGKPMKYYRPDCKWIVNNATRWCFANIYDPEGSLATVPTVMSVWIGTHFGRLFKHQGFAGRAGRIMSHWLIVSTVLIAAGLIIHVTVFPMNKQLWSTSYLFFMAGICGASLLVVYALVDAPLQQQSGGSVPLTAGAAEHSVPSYNRWARRILLPLQYMGMNAILLFVWHGTAENVLNICYSQEPLVGGDMGKRYEIFGVKGWFHESFLGFISTPEGRQLLYVMLKITCFAVAMWYCHSIGYFWKI